MSEALAPIPEEPMEPPLHAVVQIARASVEAVVDTDQKAAYQPPVPYVPTLDDEIMIAARQYTLAQPRTWHDGNRPRDPLTRRQILAMVSPEDRQMAGTLWPELNRLERRCLVLQKYFRLTAAEIASATHSNPTAIAQAMKASEDAMVRAGKRRPILPAAAKTRPVPEPKPQRPEAQEATIEPLTGEPIVVSTDPWIAIYLSESEGTPAKGGAQIAARNRITGFQFDTSRVQVKSGQYSTQAEKCSVLASLGLTNQEIGEQLHIAPDTVKTHMRTLFRRYGLVSRSEIAVTFFKQGVYQRDPEDTSIQEVPWHTPREKEICLDITRGLSNGAIAQKYTTSIDTVKPQVVKIIKNSGLRSREQIAMATLLSSNGKILLESDESSET